MAASGGLASLPKAVPWWGWLVTIGLLLWAAGGAFHTAIVLVLVAALVYQFTAVLK